MSHPASHHFTRPSLTPRFQILTLLLMIAGLLAGCRGGESTESIDSGSPAPSRELGEGGIQFQPLQPRLASGTGFTPLTAETTGLDFVNELKSENIRNYLINGAGLATGDYDNDGQVDVFAVSQDGTNRLFRQTAPWQFEDVTAAAGDLSGGQLWGSGATFADFNNDGWLDLYVCNVNGPNQLFVNQQNGRFTEQAEQRSAAWPGSTTMASVADYDRDGDLDIYLVNNRLFSVTEENEELEIRMVDGQQQVHPDFQDQYAFLDGRLIEAGQRDVLLQNDGRGNFSDVTGPSGIAGFDMGLSATWWDYDGDGWMDLYVANDLKTPDHLYRNQGDGTFRDVLSEMAGHTPWFSMGADAADINNDGRVDLLVADMSSTTHYKQKTTMGEMGNSAWFLTIGQPRQFMRNVLFVNSGGCRFWEAANLAGLDSTDWSWSVKLCDFDSDMLVDVFVTNGIGRNLNDSDLSAAYGQLKEAGKDEEARQHLLAIPPLKEANLAFRNAGDLKFANVSSQWGLDHLGVSQGCSVADIDRDGDLDLLVSNMNEPLGVYRNDLPGNNVLIRLVGTSSNRFGIDARLTLVTGQTRQVRHLGLARGYMSGDEPLAHFGLGDRQTIDQLIVEWPGGVCQTFEDISANQLITITEGRRGKTEPPVTPTADPWLEEKTGQPGYPEFTHSEIELDDYQRQPLLPNKLSQLGPGMAWADVNGDGRQDCFVGNSASLGARLLIQNEQGQFVPSLPWYDDAGHEDMGAVFLDVDSDGDQDLYVASGGYDFKPGAQLLQDRLYLNDGSGNFERAPAGSIPELQQSSSCVSTSDFDHDGDLDLFVGTRLVPRQWPLAATSYLLENQEGRLVDVVASRAAGLVDIGLITGSVWTDVDNDGWQDLIVSLEWGPLRCFRNDQGQLVDITDQAGLGGLAGWWNSVAAGDIDNDGDMDLVALNAGLNTKYHATPEHPVQLYARDFDKNGTLDLIETEWEGDTCFPVRGKSCSSHAMPFLKKKFTSYHEFALADVNEIYSDEGLDEATAFAVTHLQSMVFVNDGQGRFAARELPRLAQISPGFGVVINDLNGDGFADLAIAQNFLHPQPETGQMDGGLGLVLAGNGTGAFRPLGPLESGVCVTGQGMSLTRVDLNGDQAPDMVMAVNDEPIRVWSNRSPGNNRWLAVDLKGNTGNPTGIGSRLVFETAGGQRQVFEVAGGQGYLSQSPATVYCANNPADPVTRIDVRWPDGQTASQPVTGESGPLVIEYQQTASQ